MSEGEEEKGTNHCSDREGIGEVGRWEAGREEGRERRKALLDELAIRLQDTTDQHRLATQHATEEHARIVDKLSSQMAQLKVKKS